MLQGRPVAGSQSGLSLPSSQHELRMSMMCYLDELPDSLLICLSTGVWCMPRAAGMPATPSYNN